MAHLQNYLCIIYFKIFEKGNSICKMRNKSHKFFQKPDQFSKIRSFFQNLTVLKKFIWFLLTQNFSFSVSKMTKNIIFEEFTRL